MPEDKWTPEKPMPDKKDEDECQREAMARARVKHLENSYSKPEPEKTPTKGIFRNRD
jgi:hypothetical protein